MKVNPKNAHKPNKNEKGGLGPRALRRQLPFTSSPNYLPLKGKKVYLDLKNFRGVKPVEEDLLALGATIEKFLSKEINYLISSHDKARGHRSLGQPAGGNVGSGASQGVTAQSPGVSTPSPFSMGLDVSPAVISNNKKETSRGKALIRLARVDVARTVVDNAEKWGVKIVHIDSALKWILKEKEKALAVKGHAFASQNVKPKKNTQKKGKLLKAPVVKFESDTQAYRPHYLELESWPHVSVDTLPGTCPFDGVVMKSGGRRAGAQGDRLGQPDPEGQPSPCGENRGKETPKPPTTGQKAGSGKSDSVGFGHLVTGGQMKRIKEKRKRTDKKRGYCECCKIKYEDLQKHIRGDDHRKYVREEKANYKDLDVLIRKGQTAEEFLQSVVNEQALTSPVTQSQISVDSSEDVVVLLSPVRTKETARKPCTPCRRGKPCTPSRRERPRTPSRRGKHNASQDVKPVAKKTLNKSPNSKIGAKKATSPSGKVECRLEMKGSPRAEKLCQVTRNEGSTPEALLKPCSVSCEVLQLSPSKSKQGAFVVKDVKSNSEITVTVADVGASAITTEKTSLQSSESSKENHRSSPRKREQKSGDVRNKCVQSLNDTAQIPAKSCSSSSKRMRRLSLSKSSRIENVPVLTEVKTVEKITNVIQVPNGSGSPKKTSNVPLTMQCCTVTCLSPPSNLTAQSISTVTRERKKARIVSSKPIRKCTGKGSKKKWRIFQSMRHFKLPQKWRMLSDRSVSKILSSDENSEKFEGFTEADLCLPSEPPSDLSYVEVSQIALEEGSDIEWEITLPYWNSSAYEALPSQLVTKSGVGENTAQNNCTNARKTPGKGKSVGQKGKKTHFRFSPPVDRSGLGYDPGDDFKCSPDITDKQPSFVFSSPIIHKCGDSQEKHKNLNEISAIGNVCKESILSSAQFDNEVKKDDFIENLRRQDISSPFIFSNPLQEQLVTPIKTPCRLSRFADNGTNVQADDEIEFNFSSPQRLKTAFSPLKSTDFCDNENPLSPVQHSRKGKSRTSKRLDLADTLEDHRPSTAVPDFQPLPNDEISSVNKSIEMCEESLVNKEKVSPQQVSPVKCNKASNISRRMAANLARHSPRDWSKYCDDADTVRSNNTNPVTPVKPVTKGKVTCVLEEQSMTSSKYGEPYLADSHSGLQVEQVGTWQRPNNKLTLSGHKGHRSSGVRPKSQPILVHQVKRNGGGLEFSRAADSDSKDNQPQKKLLKKDSELSEEKKALRLYRFDYITTANRNPKNFTTAKRVRKSSAQRSLSVPSRDVSGMSASKRSISPGLSEVSKRQRRASENLTNDTYDFAHSTMSKWKSKSGRLIKPEDYQRRPRDEILHYSKTHLKKKKKLAAAKHSNTGAGDTVGVSSKLRSSPRKRNSPRKGYSPKKRDSLYDFDSS
ncbi:uncharacterized protein LOC135477662 isoform X2 [Liolophura sinensis]|uniref:uncharacterized protein LOC135477662 isoform X2 n=1 Tax=Liolophura sinensis TaxID=3198878 RepID=UPI0031586076